MQRSRRSHFDPPLSSLLFKDRSVLSTETSQAAIKMPPLVDEHTGADCLGHWQNICPFWSRSFPLAKRAKRDPRQKLRSLNVTARYRANVEWEIYRFGFSSRTIRTEGPCSGLRIAPSPKDTRLTAQESSREGSFTTCLRDSQSEGDRFILVVSVKEHDINLRQAP
jgi:hypothetical protein